MKKTLIASLLGAATLVSGYAQAELSANVGLVSNYLWRGMEQTQGDPAVSAGLDYSNESGFYAGTWASNASWADDVDIELDLYGGYAGKAGSWEYDVGYILFMYPGADDLDFGEIYGNFTLDALTLGVAVLSNAEGADFGDSLYLSADYSIPLSNDFELGLHVGSYTGDFVGDDDFFDIGATVSKDFWSVGISKLNEGDDEVKVYASASWEFGL